MAAMEEEQNQHLGLVGLTYHCPNAINRNKSVSERTDCALDFQERAATLRNVLPLRYAAMHYCIKANHPAVANRINREIQVLDSQTRARCMVHSAGT